MITNIVATVTVTEDDEKAFQNHVIVCGNVSQLFHFVLPLRARHLKPLRTILIFDPEPPSEEEWSKICKFPELYYFKVSFVRDKITTDDFLP